MTDMVMPPGMKKTTLCVPCVDRIAARCKELGLVTSLSPDKTIYNPVQVGLTMVLGRCLEGIGLPMIQEGFGDELPDPHKGCPIEFLESQVTEDRACPCDDPECPSREPGSIADFHRWLDDPEVGAPTAIEQYMRENGMR